MRSTATIFIVLMAMSTVAFAQPAPSIGIYADDSYTVCNEDVVLGEMNELLIVAYLGDEIERIGAAEFRVDNWLDNPGYPIGEVEVIWNSGFVVGDIATGVALLWPNWIDGPYVLLGTIQVTAYSDTYIVGEHVLEIAPSLTAGAMQIVDDQYQLHPVEGGRFTFNCVDVELCPCFSGIFADGFESGDTSQWSATVE